MLGNWRPAVDNKNIFGALLTDLSKAFDCLSHELLHAKLHSYGFSIPGLRLVYSYLQNRRQRTKINSAYISWEEILFGAPLGSILGPLIDTDFASYADDNTSYVSADTTDEFGKQMFPDQGWLVAMCRGELSAVIARLITKCQ